MNLEVLLRNKVILPIKEISEGVHKQLELIERDIKQAKCTSTGPAWRYIIGFSALGGLSRLVLLLQGLEATGLYGTSVSINLMVHFANTKLNLPPKNDLIRMRNRRNELLYKNPILPDNEEIEELISTVERIYSNLLKAPWRHCPHERCQPPTDQGLDNLEAI